jgi:hypothetical protein
VVSVFGSAAKYDNYSIFAQADVAFAFEAPFKLCLQKKADNEVTHQSCHSNDSYSTGDVTHADIVQLL